MTAPTVRHRQQLTAGVLANLLTHDLPTAYWVISRHTGRAEGLVEGVDEVRTWAQAISGGATSVRTHLDGSGSFRASGIGAHAQVEVWCPLTANELADISGGDA